MISGFNTDVESGGVVYHIQTEDKGRKSRLIVSLVYDRGTILASKRTTYGDLANGSCDENVLAEKVQRQHKLICAAIKAGRIADLVGMGDGKKKPKNNETPALPDVPAYMPAIEMPYAQFPSAVAEAETVATVLHVDKIINNDVIFEDASIVEEDAILSAEAVNVVSELSGTERPKHAKLSVELLGDTKFKGGDRRDVHIMVCRGTDRKVVRDAQVMIKILGSSFRPMIFHAKTDANGLAKVHLQLPHFHAGRAALLLRAMNDGEEIEFRRIVTPG
ncbi:MAG: hypothetical protein ACKVRN_03025 [Pyrinomonadaceae bacterium]